MMCLGDFLSRIGPGCGFYWGWFFGLRHSPPQKDFLSILFLFRLCVCVCVSACREHDNSKKALAEYFQRTRHVLIKVSSLVRWSANANDVYVCQVPILHPFPRLSVADLTSPFFSLFDLVDDPEFPQGAGISV